MKTVNATRFILVMFLIYTCGGSIAVAQFFPGRVTGSVRDAQGAAVAGATVKLSNLDTSQERTATSDQNGEFNFPELPLGTFQLTVSKDGFRTSQINAIVTSQGQVNSINPVLAVGTVSSKIEVNSAPALIQTETNESGGQLTEEQVESLPIGNSEHTRLALVLPGVTQNSNFAFAQYTINGSRARSNGFNIDGVSDTDPSTYLPSINEGGNSATAATRLPLDAIQEVTISANAGADSGQNSGSVMNVIIRSGTNRLHGSLYELHRDVDLDAANFFEDLAGVPKAPFVWNEFGGTVGGPVDIPHLYDGHNRTFFFAGYDGSRLRLGTTLHGNAPTPAQISTATSLVQSQGITPNQLGLNILGLYSSLGLSGPFVIDNRGRQTPNSEVHVFNPNLINTLRLGWNRFSQFQKGRDANVNPATIGFNTGVSPNSYGIPEIDLGDNTADGFSNLGLQGGAGGRVATSYQIANEVNWTRGKHAWKFGFNFLHNYSDYTLAGSRGIFSFTGSQLGDNPSATGGTALTTDGGLAALVDLI